MNIANNQCFSASLGNGAKLNGVAIKAATCSQLIEAIVSTGVAYERRHREFQSPIIANVINETANIRRIGSAALDLCDVACGKIDGYFEYFVRPWDIAAGMLIAAESGAIVREVSLRDGRHFVSAASSGIAEALGEIVGTDNWHEVLTTLEFA